MTEAAKNKWTVEQENAVKNVRIEIARWFIVGCAALLVTASKAEASPITISYSFSGSNSIKGFGSFTFDSALDGSVLNYGDLSAFVFTTAFTSSTYDLAFVNSAGPAVRNFAFDTATDSFVFVTGGLSPLMAFHNLPGTGVLFTGFQVTSTDIVERIFAAVTPGDPYDTVTITRTTAAAPVPEPGTLVLLGVGLGALAARRTFSTKFVRSRKNDCRNAVAPLAVEIQRRLR